MSSNPSADAQGTEARRLAWGEALAAKRLPGFVVDRLAAAGAGRTPWITSLRPAELLLARTHGMRPVAMVSGTCCYQYGWSWTEAQPAGWALALARIRAEAVACGANAVVDVKLVIRRSDADHSMDFTLTGTAVRLKTPPPGPDPAIATVSAVEFVRLLDRGIVPVTVAVGVSYGRFFDQSRVVPRRVYSEKAIRIYGAAGAGSPGPNLRLAKVAETWETLRRGALQDLRRRAGPGAGILANAHWSQLDRVSGDEETGFAYVGRHVVIATVVRSQRGSRFATPVQLVVDLRDGVSPLTRAEGLDPDLYAGRAGKGVNE